MFLSHYLHLKYKITTTSDASSTVDAVLDKTIRKVSVTYTHYVCVVATQFLSILKTILKPSVNTGTLLSRNMTWEFLLATFPFIMHIGPT
jgi:hypothetical protein